MITIPEQELAIITPSKTGSCSLHKLLCVDHNYPYIIGPRQVNHLVNTYDQHTFFIPELVCLGTHELKIRKVVCVVRNPYTRFRSLFNHYKRHNDPHIDAESFFSIIVNSADSFFRDISSLLRMHGVKLYEYWKLEQLSTYLKKYGLPHNLPMENFSIDRSADSLDLSFIKAWAYPDCDKFGYEKSGH